MSEYEIKPALLRRAVTWQVGDDALRRGAASNAAGNKDRSALGRRPLAYREITGLRLTRTVFRGQRLERFELTGPWGREIISVNTSDVPPSANDQLAAFHCLLIDVLPRIAAARPDLEVILAERKGPQWALFAIGMSAVIAAGILCGLAALTAQDRLWAAAVPLGTLFLFGLAISLNVRPWRAPPSMPPADLAAELSLNLTEGLKQGLTRGKSAKTPSPEHNRPARQRPRR